MNLERRISVLKMLGEFIVSDDEKWAAAKERAYYENAWFIPEFIDFQLKHIAENYLAEPKLRDWVSKAGTHPGLAVNPLNLRTSARSATPPLEGIGNSQKDDTNSANPLLAHRSEAKEGRRGVDANGNLPDGDSTVATGWVPKTIGIVMAGNIPLAGFHDFLAAFISGHRQIIKPSSKDTHLIYTIVEKLKEWEPETANYIAFSEQLKNCDAYIATGSNNSARYFDYYFAKYPHIIRRNRTSAAILTGNESTAELEQLADDVYLYFGLGCRNVTKIYVPRNYDFIPLLEAFKKYNRLFDNHKYKNNYDYQLAIMIINKIYYMTNGSILLREDPSLFSPISQLNYEFYDDVYQVKNSLQNNNDIQCVVGTEFIPFGQAQKPALSDYADKANTLKFLTDLV